MASPSLRTRVFAALVACAALATESAEAQGVWRGARFGVGLDANRRLAGTGQLEVISYGEGRGSAELALVGVRVGLREEYRARKGTLSVHEYTEDTDVTGVGLLASYLFGHFRDDRGPYLGLGLGLGALDVDWRLASPTDNFQIVPTWTGGETGEERVVLGTMASLALGLQLHRNADVRAQLLTLLVSSTDQREELKFVPSLTLSAGIGF